MVTVVGGSSSGASAAVRLKQTRNAPVYVDLPAAALGAKAQADAFKPGMFAPGEFELGQSSALTVVQSAVLVRDRFSDVMRVGEDNRVSQLKVVTGWVPGDQVDIIADLQPEVRLVTSGAGFLSQGDVVHVVDGLKQKACQTIHRLRKQLVT